MRLTAILASLIGALAIALPATAGNAANDPLKIVLQRSDFPARATWSGLRFDGRLAAEGFQGKSADYAAEAPLGSGRTLRVSGQVVVLANADHARRWFARRKRDLVQSLKLQLAKIVPLPAYGDEQVVIKHLEPMAVLLTRTGSVVWSVEVIVRGTATSAQAQAYLKTYATTLKQRVGRG